MLLMIFLASYLWSCSSFTVLLHSVNTRTDRVVRVSLQMAAAARRRRGKTTEHLDAFQHLICVSSISDETVQNKTLETWKELEETVGRFILQDSCLMVAQMGLQYKIEKHQEVAFLEEYLEYYLETYDDCSGAELLEDVIVPAAEALFQFRSGDIDCLFECNSNSNSNHHDGDSGHASTSTASQSFLRQCANTIKLSKPISLPLLECFIMWRDALINNPDDEKTLLRLEEICKKLEGIALWMMLAGPDGEERLERAFDIVDYLSFIGGPNLNKDWSALPSPLDLSGGEKFDIYRALDEAEFFTSGVSAQKAVAILGRLNEYQTAAADDKPPNPAHTGRLELESVLPQDYETDPSWKDAWSTEEANGWMHRLGNLVLVNQKSKPGEANHQAFEEKKELYNKSRYPLTRRVADYSNWTPESAKACHEELLLLARAVWDL